MKSAATHAGNQRPHQPLAWLAWVVLAGCVSAPGPASEAEVIVQRTDTRTVWTTKEAEDAARAEAEARRAAARAVPPRPPAPRPAASAPAPAPAPPPVPAVEAAADWPAVHLVYFEFDRYEVKDEYAALIDAHARWLLADRSRRLVVEGHADERGGAEYNLALGQRRAESVRQRLELLGVTPAQAEAVSFGDTRPVDAARNEAAYSRNRRVELRPL